MNEIRERVCHLNVELLTHGLVVWTAGNVSERLPDQRKFIIKPSGVRYEELEPSQLVICDLDGNVVEGNLKPSSDSQTHAYIYRNMPQVGGIVHTHSTYATAWAALQLPIPCALTAMADEFGGEIPIGPFALIGGDSIGKGVVETLANHRSSAVLMKNHGVFSIGKNGSEAVKAAVMCEDVAKTLWVARTMGEIKILAQTDIDQLYERYQNIYGQ